MLRHAALVLVAAAALSPAAVAGSHGHAPKAPPQRVVVRTELVPASDGFDWLDAAAGFSVAVALAAVALLAAGHHFARD